MAKKINDELLIKITVAHKKAAAAINDVKKALKDVKKTANEAFKVTSSKGLVKAGIIAIKTWRGFSVVLKGVSLLLKGIKSIIGTVWNIAIFPIKLVTRLVGGLFNALTSLKGLLISYGTIHLFKSMISSATEFEKRLINVSTLVDAADIDLNKIRFSVLELSKEVGRLPTDLITGLYTTISAGVRDPVKALKVLKTAAKFATAGLTDTNTAVDVLTGAMNAFGIKANEVEGIADTFFKTVEQGKLVAGELAKTFGKGFPQAAALGIELNELAAAIATLTKGSIRSDIAVTSFTATMATMVKNADRFREVGVDIIKIVGEKGLTGLFDVLRSKTKGQIEQITALIPEQRALRAILALTGKQYESFIDILKLTNNATGANEEAFKKMSGSISFQFDRVKAAIQRVQIILGTKFFPRLKEVTDKLLALEPVIIKWGSAIVNAIINLPEIFTLIFDDITEVFRLFFTDFSFFQAFLDNTAKMSSSFLNGMKDMFTSYASIVLRMSSVIWSPLFEFFKIIVFRGVTNLWDRTIKFIVGDPMEKLLRSIELMKESLVKAFKEGMISAEKFEFRMKKLNIQAEGVTNKQRKMAEESGKAYFDMSEATAEAWANASDTVKNQLSGVSTDFETMKAGFVTVVDEITDLFSKIGDNIDFEDTVAKIKAILGLTDEVSKKRDTKKDPFGFTELLQRGDLLFAKFERVTTEVEKVRDVFGGITDMFTNLNTSVGTFFDKMIDKSVELTQKLPMDILTNSVNAFSDSFVNMAKTGKLSSKEIIVAMRQAAAGTIAAFAAQSAVEAIVYTARGLAAAAGFSIGIGPPATSALYFAAAAKSAAVAGIATAAALALGTTGPQPKKIKELTPKQKEEGRVKKRRERTIAQALTAGFTPEEATRVANIQREQDIKRIRETLQEGFAQLEIASVEQQPQQVVTNVNLNNIPTDSSSVRELNKAIQVVREEAI